jgi:hypothetical protein
MTVNEGRLQMPANRVSIRGLVCSAFLTLSMAVASSAVSRVDHEAECTYKKLTWDDFRGPVMNGQQQAWIVAMVVLDPVRVEMKLEEGGGGAIARARNPAVYALMNKLESGARPGARNEENLAHEQIHFDLTEYLARRLSRELRALTVEGPTATEELQRKLLLEVEKRYNETQAEYLRLQRQYDSETGNGTRDGAQKKWAKKAAELLASEEPYELR